MHELNYLMDYDSSATSVALGAQGGSLVWHLVELGSNLNVEELLNEAPLCFLDSNAFEGNFFNRTLNKRADLMNNYGHVILPQRQCTSVHQTAYVALWHA